jgi:long-chain fatty acid transport protein
MQAATPTYKLVGIWNVRVCCADGHFQHYPGRKKIMRSKELIAMLGILALVAFGAVNVSASGYAIIEQSVRGLGTAYAGAAALAQDPSTIFYNPAGLVRLSGKQVEVGLHYIMPKAEFNNNEATTVLTTPLTGGDGGDGGESAIVPNLYYSQQLSDGVVVGLGIFAPFGLGTKYDRNWVGRYHAVESRLSTLNINPTMAVRIDGNWSVGAGISIEQADAVLSNKVDFGTIGQVLLGGALGGTPQGDDGFAEVEGDDWAYGFNIGLLYEPTESTRFGLSFRSSTSHKVKGDVTYQYETSTAEMIATTTNLVDGNVTAAVDLPETLSLAGYHAISDKLAMLADITFMNWDRYKELRIKYDTGQPDTVVTAKWNDSWRYGLGLIYSATPNCTGRVGLAYDQSPVSSDEYRTPRIPDGDRFWIAIGGGYKVTEKFEFNLGYTHIFVDDPKVNKTATGEDTFRGAIDGKWDAGVDIFSVNATYVF